MLQSGEFPFVETHVVYDRTTMNSLLPHIHPDERLIINLVDQLEPGTHLAVQLPPEFLEPEEGTSRPRLPAGYEYSVIYPHVNLPVALQLAFTYKLPLF